MKRIYSIAILMAFTASAVVAQELRPEPEIYTVEYEVCVPSSDDPVQPLPVFSMKVTLTDENVILEPYYDIDDYRLTLYINGILADNPCVLTRGRSDYEVLAYVLGECEGMEPIEYYSDVLVPAAEHFVPDVDGDGVASVADVTMLTDYILSLHGTTINQVKADCDGDGSVSIADAIALIDYLISGTW